MTLTRRTFGEVHVGTHFRLFENGREIVTKTNTYKFPRPNGMPVSIPADDLRLRSWKPGCNLYFPDDQIVWVIDEEEIIP